MKQILLAGTFNAITHNLYQTLSEKFQIQLGSEQPEVVIGILKMMKPDVILISTLDMTSVQEEMFSYIREMCSKIPVICIGNSEELSRFERYFETEQFEKLLRPLKMQEIIERIYDRLHMSAGSGGTLSFLQKRRKCILLIDDSAIQLRTMRGLLQESYDVEMAKSGEEALKVMRHRAPDLIFLDYDMPGCDGCMVLEQIREDEWFKEIPVIFLTGVKDRKRINAVMSLNPAGYMLKPVTQKQIIQTVQDIIGL